MDVAWTAAVLLMCLSPAASAQPSPPTAEWVELLKDAGLQNGIRPATRFSYPADLQAQAQERWERELPTTARASWEFIEIAELQGFSENPDNPAVGGPRIGSSSRDGTKRLEVDLATGVIRYVIDAEREWRNGCNPPSP